MAKGISLIGVRFREMTDTIMDTKMGMIADIMMGIAQDIVRQCRAKTWLNAEESMDKFLTALWVIILIACVVSGVMIIHKGWVSQIEFICSWVINLIFIVYMLASGR